MELISSINNENEEVFKTYDYDNQAIAITQKRIFKSLIQNNNVIMEYYPYEQIHYMTFNLLEFKIIIHNTNLSSFELDFRNSHDLIDATKSICKYIKLK